MVTGNKRIDKWVDQIVTAIETNGNITASPPLQAHVGPTGTHLSMATQTWQLAKSTGSGIPAMSGTTPGSGTVNLYDFGGTSVSSQGITDTAYNLASSAVGNNKWLLLAKVGIHWVVLWEDCE